MLKVLPVRTKLLNIVHDSVSKCTKCKLHETRIKAALYRGNPEAELMFVGEALGEEESKQGKPFVGRAGKLLDNMIRSIDVEPDDVYVCNVVNDRPPNNRKPEPDEINACIDYLWMQIEIISPVAVVALGATATEALLGPGPGILKRRGERYECTRVTSHGEDSVSVFPTLHPSALLRNPKWKELAWDDMQNVKKFLDQFHEFLNPNAADEMAIAEEAEREALKEKRKALRAEERRNSKYDR